MSNRNLLFAIFKSRGGQTLIPVDSNEIYLRSNRGRYPQFGKTIKKPTEDYASKTCTKKDDFSLYIECIKDGLKDKDEKKTRRNLSKLLAGGIVQYLQTRQSGYAKLALSIYRICEKADNPKISDTLKQILKESGAMAD